MEILIRVIHVVAALAVIGLVLLQHGKGADVGAAFGGGASGSLFGSSGSANFLSRATAILAMVFFLTSLGLTYFSTRKVGEQGVMATKPAPVQSLPEQIPAPGAPAKSPAAPSAAPAAPVAPAANDTGSKAGEVPK